MKIIQQLTTLAAILVFTIICQAQNESLEMMAKKYDESIKANNEGVGILIKKEGEIETHGVFEVSEKRLLGTLRGLLRSGSKRY